MKRSEFQQLLAEDLRKHENIFRGYKKGSINLRCATDNLASYLMKVIEEHMVPLGKDRDFSDYGQGMTYLEFLSLPKKVYEWEPDEEE